MPNWKKVIISGSDASFNSLIVDNGITGSLQGTSSYAITASYVLPLVQNVIITGSLSNGSNTIASGSYSHAEGAATIASGDYSHAEGFMTRASGSFSHAEGNSAYAIGPYSHAEGSSTQANGLNSHAEGQNAIAAGDGSHAEGSNTTTAGDSSHAEGFSTIAAGDGSHAEGSNTITNGDYSHAEGYGTVTSGSYQHVQGQWNLSSSAQSAFIIGNGIDASNRSNLVFASGSTFQVTGSVIATEGFTGSLFGTASWSINAITSSYALTASYALNSLGGGGSTGSLLTTASFSDPIITFTKGDGTTFGIDLAGLQMTDPLAAYYTLTASILSGTTISLPNGLTYVSSSTYEFLEVHVNGLQLRYNIDYIPMSTSSVKYLLSIPTDSELIYKSYKRP